MTFETGVQEGDGSVTITPQLCGGPDGSGPGSYPGGSRPGAQPGAGGTGLPGVVGSPVPLAGRTLAATGQEAVLGAALVVAALGVVAARTSRLSHRSP